MSETGRNRAQGWQHAKVSGHENEDLITQQVRNSNSLQRRILLASHNENEEIVEINVGGSHEKDVPSILGGSTKSKADMTILLKNGKHIGISIKKSLGGQVYLITTGHFLAGFEAQYQKKIPDDIKMAIELFWGSSPLTEAIYEKFNGPHLAYERYKHRLVGDTLNAYSSKLYIGLLNWFKENIELLFDFCFSKGLANNKSDHASLIWYKNDLGENRVDLIVNIDDLKHAITPEAEYGNFGGGTTIQLPFGFVQWHSPRKVIPGSMQFHHSYKKNKNIVDHSSKKLGF